MFQMRSSINHWLRAILSLILVIVLVLNYPSQALAIPFENIIKRVESIFAPPKTKAKLTAIGGRGVAGSGRGRCPALDSGKDEIPLTAFVPVIQEEQPSSFKLNDVSLSKLNYVWGKTTEAYPTFWFYVPYLSKESEVEYGKFVLLDKDKHSVASPIFVKIPDKDKPSIAKFTLPKTTKPLEINQEYNWYFSIICDSLKPSRNPGVTGWIERVNLPILPPQNYLYYAQQGIWYDTVTRLVQSANLQTQSAQKDWILLVKYIFQNVKDKDTLQQISSIQDIQELIPVANQPTL